MEPTQQGSLPFLDTLATTEQDNTFSTSVYRKPTHTDQYLHWDSNHHITAKQSVFNTPAHGAKVCILLTRQIRQGTPSYQDSTTTMPVSRLGPQLVAPQVYQPQPTQQQQQHQQQLTRQQPQQKEHYHSSSIHARGRGKVQEIMQKERNTGTFQRHQHTKDTVRQPQGQGSQKQPNRDHLPLPMPPNKLCQCLHRRVRQITGERVKEHFKAPSPPYTATPQDTQWTQNSSTLSIKRSTTSPGPSRKPCSSVCRTQPSTGTWGSTSYCTYGTTF